ncbi:MAG: hypothetical protein ABFD12_06550 [Syntrophorhabdus sp.]
MISRIRKKNWGPVFLGFILVIPIVTGGCMVNYTQRGKTQSDFDRDKRYCDQVAETQYKVKGTRVCDEVDACLKSRGWTAASTTLW